MTAPFTASNGLIVHPGSYEAPVADLIDMRSAASRKGLDLRPGELQALVEYAATIGITAEAKAPVRKRARHFAPYGNRNATCGEAIPRGAVPPIAGNSGIYSSPRFTTRRAETTCPDCRAIANITDEEASA